MKRKILVIGRLNCSFIYDNWLSSLRKKADVTYISLSILANQMSGEELEGYVLRIASENACEFAIVFDDNGHNIFPDILYEKLKGRMPVMTFYSDDEPDYYCNNNLKYDHRFDIILTHSKRGMNEHIKADADHKRRIEYLPWGYNDRVFYKMEEIEKEYDIIFIGTNFKFSDMTKFDGDVRRESVLWAYECCRKHGFKFAVFGNGWDRDPALSDCYGGYIDPSDINRITNASRIVLGLGYAADNVPGKYETKMKHFENAGAGSYQLVNENPELREIFGDSIGYFSDENDMEQEILWALSHEREREERAGRMREIAVHSCTFDHRVDRMLEIADEYCGRREASSEISYVKPLNPEKHYIDSRAELLLLIEKLKAENDSDIYVQIIDKKLKLFDYNDTVLRELRGNPDIVRLDHVYTFAFKRAVSKKMQQRRPPFNARSLLVRGSIDKTSDYYDSAARLLIGINGSKFYPVFNFLFKKDKAADILMDFYQNNEKAFLERGIAEPGWTVAEALIVVDQIPALDEVVKRIRKLIDQSIKKKNHVAVYGAGGLYLDEIKKTLSCYGRLENISFIDKSVREFSYISNTGEKEIYNVYQYEELMNRGIRPDVFLITPAYHGYEIIEFLREREPNKALVPLCNLDDKGWDYILEGGD